MKENKRGERRIRYGSLEMFQMNSSQIEEPEKRKREMNHSSFFRREVKLAMADTHGGIHTVCLLVRGKLIPDHELLEVI